jgi:hypothetical protein
MHILLMRRCLVATFFAVLLAATPANIRADDGQDEQISFQVFYDALAPYGDWVDVDGYGYCWQPRVSDGWRPYTDGRWAYTDAGWTWISNEPFGWATYHYGRWADLRDRGWVWVPGYEWAPAWVSWRTSDEYIGWAPLPPDAAWDADNGFDASVDNTYDIGPDSYNFCPVADFGAPELAPEIVNPADNEAIVYNTVNVTFINFYQHEIYCGGPNWTYLNHRGGRPIPQYRLDRRRNYDWASLRSGGGRAQIQNETLVVPAPQIATDVQAGPPPKVVFRTSSNNINRGWDGVHDSRARDQIRERNRQQAASHLSNQPPTTVVAQPIQRPTTLPGTVNTQAQQIRDRQEEAARRQEQQQAVQQQQGQAQQRIDMQRGTVQQQIAQQQREAQQRTVQQQQEMEMRRQQAQQGFQSQQVQPSQQGFQSQQIQPSQQGFQSQQVQPSQQHQGGGGGWGRSHQGGGWH